VMTSGMWISVWRGVMQPLLQRHMAPIWAGLIIGATWGLRVPGSSDHRFR
jgi:hypothetical protein